MKIKEAGKLTEYETLPKRKLYIAVYRLSGGSYFSSSNEVKSELVSYIQKLYGADDVRIYTVDLE